MLTDKYKHYIEEKPLLGLDNERIDFLKLKGYDFFDQKNLINSIFTTYNDLILKGVDLEIIKDKIKSILVEFHSIYGVGEQSVVYKNGEGKDNTLIQSRFFNIDLSNNIELILNPHNIDGIYSKYLGGLFNQVGKNSLNSKSDDVNIRHEVHKDININNSTDIEIFFDGLKYNLLDTALRGFQTGYNAKTKDYRKLLYFNGDYVDGRSNMVDINGTISNFLRDLQDNNVIKGYDFLDKYENLTYGLHSTNLFSIKLDNDKLIQLNALGGLRESIKGLYFSFDEKSYEILDFFEKLYFYRKNHIVENTKGDVKNIIDLLDVSPFNDRLNRKNVTRSNLVIREYIDKAYSIKAGTKLIITLGNSDTSKYKKLVDGIKGQFSGGGAIMNSEFPSSFFNHKSLDNNHFITDFIFEDENSEIKIIEMKDKKIVHFTNPNSDGYKSNYYLDLYTFDNWKTNEKATIRDYLGLKEFDGVKYHMVTVSEQFIGDIRLSENEVVYISMNNNLLTTNMLNEIGSKPIKPSGNMESGVKIVE